jgi:aminoglycoside phosphotransferase (APT) family kinase protein
VHAAGIAALSPADHVSDTAVETQDGAVAFWPLLRPIDRSFDWAWLATSLKRLHGLPVPSQLLSLWDPVGRIEERLNRYRGDFAARNEYIPVLAAACARARQDLETLTSSTVGVGLVHGDPLNVVVTSEGPVLLDFDLAGCGPADWDLASVAVSHRRFGRSAEGLRQFSDAYGIDVRSWQSFETLVRVRELLDCSFALSLVGRDPAAAGELDLRMRAWLEPDDRSRWTPLPSVGTECTA